MDDERTMVVTVEELWLLQAVVRHEGPQQREWHFPPFSLSLNDQVAEGIDFCERFKAVEFTLSVSRGDLLVMDFCVPQSAKSPAGQAVGRSLLLKVCRARQPDLGPDATEPPQSSNRLQEWISQSSCAPDLGEVE